MSDLILRVGSELDKKNSGVGLIAPYSEEQIRQEYLTPIAIGFSL